MSYKQLYSCLKKIIFFVKFFYILWIVILKIFFKKLKKNIILIFLKNNFNPSFKSALKLLMELFIHHATCKLTISERYCSSA